MKLLQQEPHDFMRETSRLREPQSQFFSNILRKTLQLSPILLEHFALTLCWLFLYYRNKILLLLVVVDSFLKGLLVTSIDTDTTNYKYSFSVISFSRT